MDKTQAKNMIGDIFENSFDRDRFCYFILNLLNLKSENISEALRTYDQDFIPKTYQEYIDSLQKIANYKIDEKEIDVLIVRLKKQTSVERARTMQRNFIAWYLKPGYDNRLKDAALAAFVSPNDDDWRFSLVKMDYSLNQDKDGGARISEVLSPAKRWSFLVGSNERSHTAQAQLLDIVRRDDENITLKQLEEAFSVEKVTKEFFSKYHELFFRTNEALEEIISKDLKVKTEFEGKNIKTSDFAKKLLGQIVFLYFLQKKGWFGVGRDADWGTGPKDFLRELFVGKHGQYNNFYNDILEFLFYDALRNDRSHNDDYYTTFNCKIPFLNGGLFDPLNNYDWVHADIFLPNELFSNNTPTKEGDTGDGILDVFDRYNFTVKEDEPLEKEVAVDPEMLGKVFENLLEVKDRKSKGTYYTPREIVHYMCQQSLINYLETELKGKVSRDDIESLINIGEKIGEDKESSESINLEFSNNIPKNVSLIDEKLAFVKVCDPAVGSGAFLVGMMAEILRTRNILSKYIKDPGRTNYNFKRECIENSLYGVDIDPGAVEIAKLRLWLSLVVDEEDIKDIKPLPNLDYKIVCGNSLLSVELNLFNQEAFNKLEKLKPIYFGETDVGKKQEYKKKIDKLIFEVTNGHEEFDFEVYFAEVFSQKGGFDVVIANPPYITYKGKQKINLNKGVIEQYLKLYSNSAEYKINSFALFLERGAKLLSKNGILTYIIPSTFLQNEYLSKIRKYLLSNFCIKKFITFGNKVFKAVTDSIIIFVTKIYSEEKKETIVIRKNDLDFSRYDKVLRFDPSKWLKINDGVINIRTNAKETGIISKIETNSVMLDNFLNVYVGIVANYIKNFLSDSKLSNQYKKYLQGRHIAKYEISPAELFINFDTNKLHSNTDESVYLQPEKILMRKTGNILVATYDNKQFYTDQSIYNLYPKSGNELSLKYILALLNSILMNFYFKKKMITNPDVFPYIKGIHLKKLPLKYIQSNSQKPFVELVDKILSIVMSDKYCGDQTKKNQVNEYEEQIDKMVYELYGLTPEEIKIVENASK